MAAEVPDARELTSTVTVFADVLDPPLLNWVY